MVLCCKVPGIILCHNTFFCRIHYYALSHLRPPGTIPRQPCGVWTVLLCPGRQADGCIGCFWARRCRITGLCRQLPRPYCTIYTYRSIRGLYTVHSYPRQDWRQCLPSWFHQQQRPQPPTQNPASTVGTELNWRTSQDRQGVLLEVQLFGSRPGNQQRRRSLYNRSSNGTAVRS